MNPSPATGVVVNLLSVVLFIWDDFVLVSFYKTNAEINVITPRQPQGRGNALVPEEIALVKVAITRSNDTKTGTTI